MQGGSAPLHPPSVLDTVHFLSGRLPPFSPLFPFPFFSFFAHALPRALCMCFTSPPNSTLAPCCCSCRCMQLPLIKCDCPRGRVVPNGALASHCKGARRAKNALAAAAVYPSLSVCGLGRGRVAHAYPNRMHAHVRRTCVHAYLRTYAYLYVDISLVARRDMCMHLVLQQLRTNYACQPPLSY